MKHIFSLLILCALLGTTNAAQAQPTLTEHRAAIDAQQNAFKCGTLDLFLAMERLMQTDDLDRLEPKF